MLYLAYWHELSIEEIARTLECSTPIDTTGTFDTAVVETWADRSGRQWRSQITYPDGTTYDSIYQGSAIYPSAAFERGTLIDGSLGCIRPEDERFNLIRLDTGMLTLTILDELAPDERPYVRTYEELGTLVDTGVLDSRGRMADTWEQRTSGFAGFGSDANNADMALSQVTTWWVAPDSTVTERTFRNTIESIGTATSTQTLVSAETIIVSPEVFATDGYRSLGGTERPESPSGGPESTVGTAASPFDSGAAMIVYVRPGAIATAATPPTTNNCGPCLATTRSSTSCLATVPSTARSATSHPPSSSTTTTLEPGPNIKSPHPPGPDEKRLAGSD